MQHTFFFDGDSKKIAWVIKTDKKSFEENRDHAEIYLDKVTSLQSKYIALHVGLFWGIGKFIIKNEDNILIKIDDQKIFDHLSGNEEAVDEIIRTRSNFISKFILQRKLNVDYELIDSKNNLSSKLI
ncbi:MAG: hypothetical protein GTN35_04130 [Nitrososphaeria archaeon]|nr:hypothetical protein [Nitrosopumilaceae archaeon]NIP10208.1 hypothetical protein [Nitrosopumilaceae archaeon]NIP91572.1 hypothetical protein [Nitrososphaeria archaeon]NIS95407.1 hypothetical protein [Nitrosopumilaceae archaeon]